jgi:hypothetical protein
MKGIQLARYAPHVSGATTEILRDSPDEDKEEEEGRSGRGWTIGWMEDGSIPMSLMDSELKMMPLFFLKHSRIIHRKDICARLSLVPFRTEPPPMSEEEQDG